MQAITTKFIPPTNFKGARYKAMCEAGTVTLDCDYSLNSEGNHARAAKALVEKMNWQTYGLWVNGGLCKSCNHHEVFVCVQADSTAAICSMGLMMLFPDNALKFDGFPL